jgi:multidrug efflux pump subunit AcrB
VKAIALLRRYASAVWLFTVVLIALGLGSAAQMPSGIYPEVEFPRIVVVARSGDAPPDVFLTTVTRPLEQALTTVLGIERIKSRTIRGATEISLQFIAGTDMWRALQVVQAQVAEARSDLPDHTDVSVEKITTGSFPVVTFNLSGPVDPRELREFGELVLRPAIAGVPGVGRVEVLGGDVREVEVVLDPEAATALHLAPSAVAERLRASMSLESVGRVEKDAQLVTVLADAQPKTVAEIGEVPALTTPAGGIVPIRSIAEVIDGAVDRTNRIGGPRGETVVVSVARLPDASTSDVVRRVEEAARALAPVLPKGATLTPVYDQATLVEESMASVRDAILVGIGLCFLVITAFLKDVRAGVVHSLSVPVTLSITFLFMRLARQTLNLMSLGGMAVAIGLVIDDAIVIVESIAYHQSLGKTPADAAADGTVELAPAVTGTTLTTVVVFIPLAFLQGVVGDFFRALAFTVTAAVLVSLFVALVLVPLAAGVGLSEKHRADAPPGARYGRVVRALVRRPALAAILLVAVTALGFVIAPAVPAGFLPSMDEGAFVLDYFLPAGTSLKATSEYAHRIEKELRDTPEVRTFSRRTGAELGPVTATVQSRGDVMVRLVDRADRKHTSLEVIADLRERIQKSVPEARVEFVQVLQDVLNDLAGNPHPIEYKIFGPDYAKLEDLGEKLADRLKGGEKEKGIAGLVDLYEGHERPSPELRFVASRDAAARLGVTPDAVAAQLRSALRGEVVGSIRRFDRLVGVRVRYPNPVRFDPLQVKTLPFVAGDRAVTFGAVTDLVEGVTASERLHEALQPVVVVHADHQDRDLGSIGRDIDARLATFALPSGYRKVVGGQIESERATERDVARVGGVALLLVLTVLAGQFRRLRLAALVLVSVPVAIVGALLSLLVTGTQLNASSLMGCVLLVGLVVKNGVLLLEETERLVEKGRPPVEAVVQAAERRLRPILMTTTATLAGLFPLALGIGAGAELQKPLAVAVIGGLFTSTLATLGLMPSLAALALRGSTTTGTGPPARPEAC